MISKYIREQKRYTQNELCVLMECTEEEIIPIIRKLKEYGILKAISSSASRDLSEINETDIEIADVELDGSLFYYVFTFVGIITVYGRILKCYPKYLLNVDNPKEELYQVIRVLEKYNSKEQIIRMSNSSGESNSFNLLAVYLFLLSDYFENGSYRNTEEIIESNGTGEIIWDKTINDTFTFIRNNRPYYLDLQTRKCKDDEFDYIKRLHECVISIATKELQDAELLDLFDLTGADLSDDDLDDFGDTDYILYRLENELNVQFNTRKQLVLKTLYSYISRANSLSNIEGLSFYGTNSFNLVWEDVCAEIFGNKLNKFLDELELPIPLNQEYYSPSAKLIDVIEKPLWSFTGKTANNTLIPDLVSFAEIEGDYHFIIFDAKYYNAKLEPGTVPTGQPGIESITKQYLYQLAFKSFIDIHGFTAVENCFLLPTENEEIIDKGFVSMQMLNQFDLKDIQIRFLPAKIAFQYYLSGKKMNVTDLNLVLN